MATLEIPDKSTSRFARQSALMLAAVHRLKEANGLSPVHVAISSEEAALLPQAHQAIETARNENGHDAWHVATHPMEHESTKAFLLA